MKTLNEYIEELRELQDNGYGECIIVYASDDEGNSHHKVHNDPIPAIAEDIKEYYIDLMEGNKNYNIILIN